MIQSLIYWYKGHNRVDYNDVWSFWIKPKYVPRREITWFNRCQCLLLRNYIAWKKKKKKHKIFRPTKGKLPSVTISYHLVKVSYPVVKFGGLRYSGSKDIMVLVCDVILQDHVIKASCNVWVGATHGRSPHCLIWWP